MQPKTKNLINHLNQTNNLSATSDEFLYVLYEVIKEKYLLIESSIGTGIFYTFFLMCEKDLDIAIKTKKCWRPGSHITVFLDTKLLFYGLPHFGMLKPFWDEEMLSVSGAIVKEGNVHWACKIDKENVFYWLKEHRNKDVALIKDQYQPFKGDIIEACVPYEDGIVRRCKY